MARQRVMPDDFNRGKGAMSNASFWVVRLPKRPEVIEAARAQGAVAVGYWVKESVGSISDRDGIREIIRRSHPELSEGRVNVAGALLFNFAHAIKEGDWILTPVRDSRMVLFGRVVGQYEFIADLVWPGACHVRRVRWQGEFPRDSMRRPLLNSIGCLAGVFNLDDHRVELVNLIERPPTLFPEPEPTEVISFWEDVKAKSDEMIGDLIAHLDAYDFQQLVAGLLQAVGYRTRVSEPGPDAGVDIIAHPDALGFETPRIKVQVKHRQSAAGGPEIRNLVGTLGPGEQGLFVSTGGFTTDARREATRNVRPVTILDSADFVDLLTEYYDSLDANYKAMIPLKKVWLPARSG